MVDAGDDLRRLEDAAARLRNLNSDPSLAVAVDRRWRGPFIVEGLGVSNLWTDVFEPVRRRLLGSGRWRALQPLDQAELAVQWFLTERPDLRGQEQ
jgi:hypothetical protein